MLKITPTRPVILRFARRFDEFRKDEGGAVIGIFVLFLFFMMLIFGGIAVDVMRYEWRRETQQQAFDRATLASASLLNSDSRTPQQIFDDWISKSNLGDQHEVDYAPPVVTMLNDAGLRRVTASSQVRSYNHFMHLLNIWHLEGPTRSEAAQGVSEIEVMLVLDITGSMNGVAVTGDPETKIQALRESAGEFVTIVKGNDTRNGVSIGMVPYAAQVNIPANLRDQFMVAHLSSWDGINNVGVPNINCIEIPTATYGSSSLSQSSTMAMAAVADANSATTTTTNYVAPGAPSLGSRICTTTPDTGTTAYNDELVNHVFLPTKIGADVETRIARLTANGTTSIALGMRWGAALLDEAARPIYTAIGDASVAGRPADNDSIQSRKILILMTDGEHVSNNHVFDAFKTGLSPIWRGTDGRFAIRYTSGGPAITGGTRPVCAGANTYFVPHLKPNTDTTCNTVTSAGRVAWVATPAWTGSGVVTRLDWSEVWRYVRVSWVARQLYMRSNVSGTSNYNTIMNQFRGTYLSVSNMNTLLQQNCTAAKAAGIEIYGIAFAAPANGQSQINGCASSPKDNYYYDASNAERLQSAFRAIATDISELRLTQ